ncbi:MAG: LVIVD repeat-containing protein [Candidatus Hodarchaeales archaeon]|jgi:hypothetical protein
MKKTGKLAVMMAFVLVLNFSILVNGITQIKLSNSVPLSTHQQFDLVELGQIVTGGVAYDIQVIDNLAYLAAGSLFIIDVSDPVNPQVIGSYTDGTGTTEDLCIIDDLAFVAGGSDGLEIINISDPSNPVEIGSFNDGSQAHEVSVLGTYAFVADGEDGLEVIDVSDPLNPTEVTQYNPNENVMNPDGVFGVIVANEFVFILNTIMSGDLIDISDLLVLNISEISNITQIGTVSADNNNMYISSFVSGNLGYFTYHGSNMNVKMIDISNASNFQELGDYNFGNEATPNKMDVVDDLVYVAGGNGGLRVVNFSNPAHPVEVSHYFDGGYAYDVQVVGNLAYVADRLDGLEIIQLYERPIDTTTTVTTNSVTSTETDVASETSTDTSTTVTTKPVTSSFPTDFSTSESDTTRTSSGLEFMFSTLGLLLLGTVLLIKKRQ